MVPGIRPFLTEGGLYFNLKYVKKNYSEVQMCVVKRAQQYIYIDVQRKTDDIVTGSQMEWVIKKFLKHFKIAGRVDETDWNNTCEFHSDRPSELRYQISTRCVYYLVASRCIWFSYLNI